MGFFPNICSKLHDPKLRAILCCLIECFMLNHTTTIFSSVEYKVVSQNVRFRGDMPHLGAKLTIMIYFS